MDSHLLCDGAIGVTLFCQRTHLIMLGLARLPPQRIGIGKPADSSSLAVPTSVTMAAFCRVERRSRSGVSEQ